MGGLRSLVGGLWMLLDAWKSISADGARDM